jgi:hypothetical protein
MKLEAEMPDDMDTILIQVPGRTVPIKKVEEEVIKVCSSPPVIAELSSIP